MYPSEPNEALRKGTTLLGNPDNRPQHASVHPSTLPLGDEVSPLSTTKRNYSTSALARGGCFLSSAFPVAVARGSLDLLTETPHTDCDGGSIGADSAAMPGGAMGSKLSRSWHNPSSHEGDNASLLLNPITINSQLSQRVSSECLSPFACSRSCESAWVVVDYGVTAEQGIRRTMEDQHTMQAEGIPFFGVYDGHGGTQCAEYLRDSLHRLILGHPDILTNPEKAITDGIVEADHDFLQRSEEDGNESGSVCAVAVFVRGNLVVGNVGDCEAVLCRGGQPVLLTVAHSPRKNADEAARVLSEGGRVVNHRVGHPKYNPSLISLAVSRALGDAGFKLDIHTDGKRSGVIAVPDTKSIALTPEDEFLIIGCDGLWDVMSYAEVTDFCRGLFLGGSTPKEITERLVDEALLKGTTDNVTVAFISCQSAARQDGGNTPHATTHASPHFNSASSANALFGCLSTSPMRHGQSQN